MKINFSAWLSGLLFSLGLGISGMTRPDIVQGFLDVFGKWNWSLMGVMIGAIAVFSISYRIIIKKSTPLFSSHFSLPTKKDIDWRLITGASIFGIGWGWSGICPGPAITSLAGAQPSIVLFIISMLLGMGVFKVIEKKFIKAS